PQLVSTNYYDDRVISVDEPMATQTTANKYGLLTPPFIAELRKDNVARSLDEPMASITAGGGHHALITPFLTLLHGTTQPIGVYDRPLNTIVAAGSQHALITSSFLTSLNHSDVRNSRVDQPMPTVMPFAHPALVMAYYGNQPTFAPTSQPMPT